MKLHGHVADSQQDDPVLLEEVTLVASPAVLRWLAAFLTHAAERMEAHGADYGHEHFEDFAEDVPKGPGFVVARPDL